MDEPKSDGVHKRIGTRFNTVLDRVEAQYLKILRAMLLIIATGLIAYAAVLAITSFYKILQSPGSVREETASVEANELTSAELPAPSPRPGAQPADNPNHRRAYDEQLTRYYQLYRTRFERFKQGDDRSMSRSEFDDRFVGTAPRLAAIRAGDVNFDTDIADLRSFVDVMAAAADLPATRERLQRYRTARRVEVCQNVERMRTTYVPGWDPYGTTCPNWYEDLGCPTSRPVQTPYTARECAMRFPEGTQSHLQILRAFQDRYFSLLSDRRMANSLRAQNERDGIVVGIAEGKLNLWTALLIGLGFLALMFFFLLIAIERHQRLMATRDQSSTSVP